MFPYKIFKAKEGGFRNFSILLAPVETRFTSLEGFFVAEVGSASLLVHLASRLEIRLTETTGIAVIGEGLAGVFAANPDDFHPRPFDNRGGISREGTAAGDHLVILRAGKAVCGDDGHFLLVLVLSPGWDAEKKK